AFHLSVQESQRSRLLDASAERRAEGFGHLFPYQQLGNLGHDIGVLCTAIEKRPALAPVDPNVFPNPPHSSSAVPWPNVQRYTDRGQVRGRGVGGSPARRIDAPHPCRRAAYTTYINSDRLKYSRGERIRTADLLVPSQAR